jgi:quinoprotein glucose dehydrogenase
MVNTAELRVCSGVIYAFVALLMAPGAFAQHGKSGSEWRSYAGDRASTKYSPLSQIDRDSVERLEIAWQWKSVDYAVSERLGGTRVSNIFESTPLMFDDTLYLQTNLGVLAAIDPRTGETKWLWDPYLEEKPQRANMGIGLNRGTGNWTSGDGERIFLVNSAHLVSLDAKTGKQVASFGTDGRVDLRLGIRAEPLRAYHWTSPPLICGDVVVLGNSTLDPHNRKESEPGYIRGYDAASGKLEWVFHIIPLAGEVGYDTWEEGSAEYTGHGNVWTWMSCDEELGMVYAPTSTPTNDWYGGHRPGSGLFAESLVALDAKTGERKWHFQAVHHGLWDYDFPAAPILADVVVNGESRKVVAQVSKQAFLYVFDRVTGEPIWPIEERSVPASDVAGEKAHPTQPHPTRPAPYDLNGLTPDDLIDLTPELNAEAREILDRHRWGPIFLPPWLAVDAPDGKLGAVQSPGPVGGSDWNGAALDPETGILYIPSVTAPFVAGLTAPTDSRSNVDYLIGGGGFLQGPQGLPITKPPWGRITAIDLNTGEHLWVAANGDGPRDHQALAGLDLPPLGHRGRAQPLVTKTLLFVTDGSKDMIAVPPGGGGRSIRALDKKTGEVVWEKELPAGNTGSLMSYESGGEQYIVVPVGESGYQGALIALKVKEGTI